REEIEPGASFDHDLLPADGVILVVDLSVDVTELHHREQNDDEHQDDGLRRGGTDVQPLEAGGVNLIDQNGGGGAGPALRHDVNDGEGIEKGINDVHHQKEEGGGRQQRKNDGPESAHRPRPVDGGGFQQGARNGLQPRQEEHEVIGNLFPDRRKHHQNHGVVRYQTRVPGQAGLHEVDGQNPDRGRKQEEPEHPRYRSGDGIGPDQHVAVDAGGLDDPVGQHCQEQGHTQPDYGDQHREIGGDLEGIEIVAIAQQFAEILQPDELAGQTEGVFQMEGLP